MICLLALLARFGVTQIVFKGVHGFFFPSTTLITMHHTYIIEHSIHHRSINTKSPWRLGKQNISREVRSKVKPGSSEKKLSKIFRAVVSPSAMASTSTAPTVILKVQNSSTLSNRVKHTCGEWSDVN
jgi:hypothetical protein